MKLRTLKSILGLAGVAASALAWSACDAGNTVTSDELGTIHAALIEAGDAHDVAAIQYEVFLATGPDLLCDTTESPIATALAPLEDEFLPGWVAADPLRGDAHLFADSLFVLPPGLYLICASPVTETGEDSEWCGPVSDVADVVAQQTHEILLISNCRGTPQGGLDVVTGLNDPPEIIDIEITPSKFITQCEEATIYIEAIDPNGDALTFAWLVDPEGSIASTGGGHAVFTPAGTGEYTIEVMVRDPYGGRVTFAFPIHVSPQECGGGGVTEHDVFEGSVLEVVLVSPDGQLQTLLLEGTSAWDVFFEGDAEGDALDDDGNGLDEVQTEIVSLELSGDSAYGPVHVRGTPGAPGLLEESTNLTPGRLDVAPFHVGVVDSFFDIFFEIEIGEVDPFHLYPAAPLRFQGRLENKPPQPGERLIADGGIALLGPDGEPTGFFIEVAFYTPAGLPPAGTVETDHFAQSEFGVDLIGPDGQSLFMFLRGPSAWQVFFPGPEGSASDLDGDGRDQVSTEIVAMDLVGFHPELGEAALRLSPAHPSLGEIEEFENLTPGALDLHPFHPGAAESFFDVFVELDVAGTTLLNLEPLRMAATIDFKPPQSNVGYLLESPGFVDLYDLDGNPTAVFLGGNTIYIPFAISQP